MLMILSLAFATGAACGLTQVRVWALFPIIVIFLLVAFVIGSSMDLTLGKITLVLLVAWMLTQVAYLIGAALFAMTPRHQRADGLPPKQAPLSAAVQKAIADELRVYFVPPNDLPQQLSDRLVALQSC